MLCAACVLLWSVLEDHAPNVQRAWRAGALPLLQAALCARGATQEDVREAAAAGISHLQSCAAEADAAADAAAAELLAGEAAAAQQKSKSKTKRNKQPQGAAAEAAAAPSPAAPADGAGAAAPERPACVICMDAPPCVVLLPCRHLLLCAAPACAAALFGLCPLCREAVADTLTVFMP